VSTDATPASDKILLIKGRAGLGNRMLCALTGILYARISGRRAIVDWRDPIYSDDGTNVFDRYFECGDCLSVDSIPDTDSVAPPVWRGNLHLDAQRMQNRYAQTRDVREVWREFSIDLRRRDYSETVTVMWAFTEQIAALRPHFEGRWSALKDVSTDEILRDLLRNALRLRPAIRERVERFEREQYRRPMLGVHVRYSDHRSNLRGILDNVAEMIAREPERRIFLCTDALEVKRMFEATWPGVVSTPHWYPRPGAHLHNNPQCPDRAESGVEALVDIALLARCDAMVIDTSSSFSYVARLLSDVPDSEVADVARSGKMPPWRRKQVWRLLRALQVFTWGVRARGLLARARSRAQGGGGAA
jgi:hypothetical protein